jgi:hypothetical protein
MAQGDDLPPIMRWSGILLLRCCGRELKGVFALAGVDSILSQLHAHPGCWHNISHYFVWKTPAWGSDAGICSEPGIALVPPV